MASKNVTSNKWKKDLESVRKNGKEALFGKKIMKRSSIIKEEKEDGERRGEEEEKKKRRKKIIDHLWKWLREFST